MQMEERVIVQTFCVATTHRIPKNAQGIANKEELELPKLNHPKGICVDSLGRVMVADFGSNVIRYISTTGTPYVHAGQIGARGNEDGAGRDARFNGPLGIAANMAGFVFVTDFSSHTLRSVAPNGYVFTLCGQSGTLGYKDGVGNQVRFKYPRGIACDGFHNIVYVCDTENHVIRKVNVNSRMVTTLCGFPGLTGYVDGVTTNARFNAPAWATVDPEGYIILSDNDNNIVRRISPTGTVKTICGSPGEEGFVDGLATMAKFYNPRGTVVDVNGNIILADYGNQCLRKIRQSDGTVSTFVGLPGKSGTTDGDQTCATFSTPVSIAMHPKTGQLFVVDEENHNVRVITSSSLIPWSFTAIKLALRTLRFTRLLMASRSSQNLKNVVAKLVMVIINDVQLSRIQINEIFMYGSDKNTLGSKTRLQFIQTMLTAGHPSTIKKKVCLCDDKIRCSINNCVEHCNCSSLASNVTTKDLDKHADSAQINNNNGNQQRKNECDCTVDCVGEMSKKRKRSNDEI